LLQKEPNNPQGSNSTLIYLAKTLLAQIDDKVKSEGMIGVAIAGGAAIVVGLIIGLLRKN
jgi:ElaB/YqjD/DUF883 family membrane-anchored ribosome-binding protein